MDLKNKLLSKIIKQSNNCWEWQGSLRSGYGQIYNNTKQPLYAHRVSYELHKGPIPTNMFVCHSCDNKKCVNPDHLWLGTPKDNSTDMTSKGNSHKGSKNHKAKLTEQEVLEIRELIGTLPPKEIAKIYNVSQMLIYYIKNRKNWTHI